MSEVAAAKLFLRRSLDFFAQFARCGKARWLRVNGVIHHVSLDIPAALCEQCASFYRLLGFEPVTVPCDLRGRVLWLERERSQIHLMLGEKPVRAGGHFAVVVTDFARTFEALRGTGYEPTERARHWGSPRAYVRDPAGNLVEFMAYPPSTGCRVESNSPTKPISGRRS